MPNSVDGHDLSTQAQGKAGGERDCILMANYVSHWDFFDSGTPWQEWRGVKSKTHTYVKWLDGKEELYDNTADPYQMNDLAQGGRDLPLMKKMRSQLGELLAEAHDEFLPGTAYADWYDDRRTLLRTALGEVK